MSKAIVLDGDNTYIRCLKCRKKYSLTVAKRKAESKDIREVKCPHCNAVVGKM